ncbi:Retrovirus-related poly from transposon [Salix suchowensis]|nr:Retrovirus-related poly from transposon [Salix suchowensis]
MKMEVDKSEPAAMVAKTRGSSFGSNRGGSQNWPGQTRPSQQKRDRPQGKCLHCGLLRHSKSRCFELIGYPDNWDKNRDPLCNKSRASIAETRRDSDLIADTASAMVDTTGRDGKALSTSTSSEIPTKQLCVYRSPVRIK